ncbi:MAG TPA: hypothetical protein VEO92_02700 [Candidatus Nitrosocosmicus sp.]|nr:hypothetical protein [Candidatus Nitrosocosmicus sp.]
MASHPWPDCKPTGMLHPPVDRDTIAFLSLIVGPMRVVHHGRVEPEWR